MPSASSTETFDIAIIGGGIAGLCLAIGLLKNPANKVTIYEAAHHFGEVGAGVAFGPNGIRAMQLLSPKIEESFNRIATSNLFESKSKQWFEYRLGQVLDPERAGAAEDLVKLDVHPCAMAHATTVRAKFLDELVKLVPEDIAHFGKRVVHIENLGAEQGHRLSFKDGTTAVHDMIIGCDGVKSIARLYVLGEDDPAAHAVFSGKYCHRALLPMEKAVEILGEERAKNDQLYMGKGGHIITFPVQGGEIMNIVAFHSKDTWDNKDWVVPSTTAEMLSDYEGWSPTLRKLLGEVKNNALDIWALFDHPPAHTFYKDRVCLTGDAAHATTPNQGSGASMAIEDAYVLSALVNEAQSGGYGDMENLFRAFDEVRRARTIKLVATSREAGLLWGMEDPEVGTDIEKLLKNAKKRMDWIWNEDLEAEVAHAKSILGI